MNLAHRANLLADEIGPDRVAGLMENEERQQLKTLAKEMQRVAANVPGLIAINELAEWYERQWEEARDFKDELLDLLNESKFGQKEYTRYQVYMKAIYEYFRDDLDPQEESAQVRSAVELSEFQEDAVKKARKILLRYDGVMVADSVGLGKTWIGKKLLEDYAYHLRYKALVICPAALQKMWNEELLSADAKLERLKGLLSNELKGQKVLIFTYYKDTARYLYRSLNAPDGDSEIWREEAGSPRIRRMDSGTDVKERAGVVAHFAPIANNRVDIAGSEQEIDVLISTDVLSEGQNLQDCGVLINYELHWNPTRMVQRAGRIDRIGTSFETLRIINMFPDDGLEKLLGLVESLAQKIASIDRSGLLDELPDGIHSGLLREGRRGVFFYFTAQRRESATEGAAGRGQARSLLKEHYWRYVDITDNARGGTIEDNRYRITGLIQCQPDTVRVVPTSIEIDIFALQEKVIESILQASVEQVAVEEAPKLLDPIQQTIVTVLRGYVNAPDFNRKEVIAAMQKLNVPQPRVYVKALRKAYDEYKKSRNVQQLLSTVQSIGAIDAEETKANGRNGEGRKHPLKREDLKLVCFDYVWW